MENHTNDPFLQQAYKYAGELDFKEQMLGKGLIQPFVDCNSGNRKLMYMQNRHYHLFMQRFRL